MSTNYSSEVITSGSSEDTIKISDSDTLDSDSIINSTMSTSLNYSINSAGSYTFTNSGTGYSQPWGTVGTAAPSTLEVKGDANFEGDIKFKGRSLEELFSKIEDRLAILQPDPAKLEKYEALRKAYAHYKLMEKLIGDD